MSNPPKPTHLKLMQGTARKDRMNVDEPKPSGDLSDPPSWVTARQREEWDYALSCAPKGLLKRLDQVALLSYCVARAQFREASEMLEKTGLLVKGSTHNVVPSPYIKIQHAANLAMMRAANEMGFTPSSRTRVSVQNDDSDSVDPWAEMANGI